MNFSNQVEVSTSAELEALFNNVDILLWSVKEVQDGVFYYERVNMAFAGAMESVPDEYNGKCINDISSPEEFQQINTSLNRAREDGVYVYQKKIESLGILKTYLIRITYSAFQNGINHYICSGTDISKRIEALNALKDEKSKTQSYLDIVGVMLLILNKDGSVSGINKKGCEILEYPSEDILGKNWFENFISPDISTEINERFKNLMNGGKPSGFYENPVVTRNGILKDILWHSNPIFDEKGKITGLLSSGEDITNIRRVENELKKHNRTLETLHMLSEGISQSVSINDIGESIALSFSANKNLAAGAFYLLENNVLNLIKAFGPRLDIYSTSIKLKLSDFLQTDNLKNKYRKVEKFELDNGSSRCTRINIALSTKNEINGLLSLTLTSEDDYTKEFYNMYALEIGRGIKRKQSEKELIDTKQLLEKITNNIPVFISLVDLKEDRVIYYNKSILKSLGYSEPEIKEIISYSSDDTLSSVYHPDDIKTIKNYSQLFANLRDNETAEIEYRFKHKNGSWQWFRHTGTVFSRDEHGNPLQTINIIENITDRIKSHHELLSTKQLLEKITQNVPVFISLIELEKEKVIYYNKSILSSIGYSENDVSKILQLTPVKYMHDMYHPDDFDIINKYKFAFDNMSDNEIYETEYRYKHKNGSWQWFRHTATIFSRDGDGKPLQTINISQNITEHKNTELMLKQKTEQLLCQQTALLEIVRTDELETGKAFRDISELTSKTLSADRVSIWMYDSNSRTLKCSNIYEPLKKEHYQSDIILQEEFVTYLKGLNREQNIYTPGDGHDPGAMSFDKQFITPYGSVSALIAKIRMKGKLIGIICYETKKAHRVWGMEDQDFAMSVSSLLSLASEVAEKKRAEEELIARNEQVIKQQAALIELSKLKESNIETTFKKITEITSPPLNSDRTSIWLFNHAQSEIECKEMFIPSEAIHSSGIILKSEEFYNYFNAKNSIPFTTHDPENDPRTKEFTQNFLHPFGTIIIIISRLRLKGDVVGMICYESKNPLKTDWTPEEYDFSLSVAGFISMILEASERNKAENAMINSLKEKELLLKEIHHRVKNNLSVISSLLYLQSKNISDRKQAEVFLECQSRVRTMVLVHEKLYQSKDIGRIDYSDYIKSLSEYLIHSFITNDSIVKINIDVKDVYLTLDTAINCGLIINELLSNSLKYAFKDRKEGIIDIKFYNMGENKFYLSIKDDGVGMPSTLNFKETSTLGLQLVTTLVDQLEGSIKLDSSSGTNYEIEFFEKPQN